MDPSHTSGLSRKLMAVDWLKADLVAETGRLFHALNSGTEESVVSTLAGVVTSAYALGLRLGINPERLELEVQSVLEEAIGNHQELEAWFGDLSRLRHHFSRHRNTP